MINGKIFCESDPWIVGTAHIVCGAGSVQLSGIRLSVCLSISSSVSLQQRRSSFYTIWAVHYLQPTDMAECRLIVICLVLYA